jgi:predicted ribonuclease YlaK
MSELVLDLIDPIILKFLDDHGSITYDEIRNLCLDLSDEEAILSIPGVNQYRCFRSGNKSQIVLYRADSIVAVPSPSGTIGKSVKVRPANLEQEIALLSLRNPDIACNVITGNAGSGKTLLTMAFAVDSVFTNKVYDTLVLTKPRTQVHDDDDEAMGEVPGGIFEKMSPQMISYNIALNKILGNNSATFIQTLIDKGVIQIIPLEHMRGVDFSNALVICDEAQNLGRRQLETLSTRIGKNSKLVLMGDTKQDDKASRRLQGENSLISMVNHPLYLQSPYTSWVNLRKVMRHPLVDLMIEIFK